MKDKIKIHIGFPSGFTGMPVAYSFVGSEHAEGSASEAVNRDTQEVRSEEAGRSLESNRGSLHKGSGARFKSWLVKMFEIGFAHPPV